jgi:putative addiction module component (TIGR02574 family)
MKYPTESLRTLSVAERLELMERIWESLEEEEAVPRLTPEQEAELDRRWAEHVAHPEEVLSWDEVQARLQARLAGCR